MTFIVAVIERLLGIGFVRIFIIICREGWRLIPWFYHLIRA